MAILLKRRFIGLLLALLVKVQADEFIYTDNALASDWQDWSWGSTISYTATDIAEGTSSISVNSTAYSALSLKAPASFATMAGFKFDVSVSQPDVSLYFQDTAANVQSPSIPLSAMSSSVTTAGFTSILLNFQNIPPNGAVLGNGSWDRINFQAGGNGAVYHVDNLELVSEIVVTPEFLSAEPLTSNLIALTTQGAVDLSTVKVKLNGKNLQVTGNKTLIPVDTPATTITYLTLGTSFTSGSLSISAGNSSFNFTLPAKLDTTIIPISTHVISDLVYGINFPDSAAYIQSLGVTLSRWGGNAVTAYNPNGDFTNAGNDWYFENRVSDDGNADNWLGWTSGAGSKTTLAIPALDWVAKDATSYSYPASVYPDQQSFDPYNGLAGDGLFPNGSYVTPVPNQSNTYTSWNTSLAKAWLTNLVHKPDIVTIDNEIEIASNTHQDMHPVPMGYDEELSRVVNFSTIAKQALPKVQVAAPSSCSWWYYWTSEIGYTDNAAHNNTDWIPWFLTQMKSAEKKAGKRLLDILDLHYYFQPDTSANDAAAKALRLRMTRSWWDPTYVDESWIGTSTPQNQQPNATIVQVIPRMQKLINQLYPGTKLSFSEWSSTADSDITGGLVTADSLGIFGKFGVDAATYWSDPSITSPVALAFWLFRGNGTNFGDLSLPVNVNKFNPDILGVYASSSVVKGRELISLVIVNKDPSNPVALNALGLPAGDYLLRHFGGQAGVAKFQNTISIHSSSYIVVPAYTAVFLQQQI
ncbi:glycoside hydrolase family 44 protein [Sphaerobolus stellatus SS14]|uniref:Glycoside hydrolase family 44 protein n=1 Tax=Sphaerobolus stellatus (strain SS14) TaxID=990650 RepID=A0A0C9UTG2_SPHS4|nr:glycoside hydrolase family 44 protein [Sphaerobolus stellatus SS14]